MLLNVVANFDCELCSCDVDVENWIRELSCPDGLTSEVSNAVSRNLGLIDISPSELVGACFLIVLLWTDGSTEEVSDSSLDISMGKRCEPKMESPDSSFFSAVSTLAKFLETIDLATFRSSEIGMLIRVVHADISSVERRSCVLGVDELAAGNGSVDVGRLICASADENDLDRDG